MPHIHGVAWMEQSFLEEKGIIKDKFLCDKQNGEATARLADELISCQLPDLDPKEDKYKHPSLGKIVRETQIHRHTPSCLKYTGTCRYNFPRLPCNKTVVARPYDEQQEWKERDKEEMKKVFVSDFRLKFLSDIFV